MAAESQWMRHKVLIFPAGSEIGLEIYRSLKYSHHVEVFGASSKSDHASFVFDEAHYREGAFNINETGFLDRFNALLREWQIEFVYPTHDSVANFLAAHQAALAARIVTSAAETNQIARFKSQTYRLFRSFDFCPVVFERPYADVQFPVFLKPDDGQGGKGTHIAHDHEELSFHLRKAPDLLVTEFLPGEELSVDCFTDFNRRLLFVGPRTRERVQMGISFRSTAMPATDEILRIAHAINDAVPLNGAWFYQIKKDRVGRYKLLEFAPRQSSTMGLFRHSGVNFALLSLFNALGKPVEILRNDYEVQLDRSLHNRFKASLTFKRVYLDFDETVVVGTHVHEYVMAFIYQCRNRGIGVVLLTKHRANLGDTLQACGISPSVFEAVVHISESQDKWAFMDADGAIFIDNHWFDRRAVKEKLGIPVFDVDAIECLLR